MRKIEIAALALAMTAILFIGCSVVSANDVTTLRQQVQQLTQTLKEERIHQHEKECQEKKADISKLTATTTLYQLNSQMSVIQFKRILGNYLMECTSQDDDGVRDLWNLYTELRLLAEELP